MIEQIKENWKVLVMLLVVILIVVYGLTSEQAFQLGKDFVEFYKGLN